MQDAEFPLDPELCYLNHAAVAPWPHRTTQAVHDFAQENSTWGATHYLRWMKTEQTLKQRLQWLINAPSVDDIALVKNTSEALSVVAYGIDWQAGDEILIPSQEFPSNRVVWASLEARFGVVLKQVNLPDTAPEAALLAHVSKQTRLISVSSVQYGSGLRMNMAHIGDFCRTHDIRFCIDAIQSLGAFALDVQENHADFVMADGHKWLLSPEGLGLFYCRAEQRPQLNLQQYGWHMLENGHDFDQTTWQPSPTATRFECGSPNMLAAHAFNASLSLFQEIGMDTIETQILARTEYLIHALSAHPRITVLSNTQTQHRSGIVTFAVEAMGAQALYHQLMSNQVICAYRGGGIRFSPHFYTPMHVLATAMQRLTALIP